MGLCTSDKGWVLPPNCVRNGFFGVVVLVYYKYTTVDKGLVVLGSDIRYFGIMRGVHSSVQVCGVEIFLRLNVDGVLLDWNACCCAFTV